MKRINEHNFLLNGKQYQLSFYEKPILKMNGLEQKVKPILREYIEKEKLPIQLVNKNGNEEVPWTLARKILEYFSENGNEAAKTNNLVSKKTEIKQHKMANNNSCVQNIKLSDNFKVVMICASDKNNNGELIFNGIPIQFFAQTNAANNEFLPDDKMPNSETTWREFVKDNQKIIPYKAYELYKRNEYCLLKEAFGNRFFILSAGWGLVRADFKLPKYDITFTRLKDKLNTYRKYNKPPKYKDFNHFIDDNEDNEDIVYIGGKDYLLLFYELTQHLPNRKIIYWKHKETPKPLVNIESFSFRYYNINWNTNWHYELAKDIANGIVP